MSEFSIAALPEAFVSDSSIPKAVYEAVDRGHLRKLGSRLTPVTSRTTPGASSGENGITSLRSTIPMP